MTVKLARSAPRIVRAALFIFALAQTLPPAALAQAGSQGNSLAEAYRIIASKQFVDLTHSFGPLTPVWKGFGPATFSAASDPATGRPYTIEKDGFRVFFYSMVGQYGTHVDPPAHFDPGGKTMDQAEAWVLKHGHWQIEVMANLDKVPATGALIVVTWPKPKHGLGFPARAFAILP